jgi:hypothetical protein
LSIIRHKDGVVKYEVLGWCILASMDMQVKCITDVLCRKYIAWDMFVQLLSNMFQVMSLPDFALFSPYSAH